MKMKKSLLCAFAVQLVMQSALLLPASAKEVSPQATPAKKIAPSYTEPTTGMTFVTIPGGTFTMGDSTDPLAGPAHEVTVKPFLLGRHEVTFEQYAKFCASTGRQLPPDDGWELVANRPVVNVTWHDAVAFTEWLSNKSGKTFRLPSEAEWEFAARGGAKSKYPWGNELGKNKANCSGCGSKWDGKTAAPVGSFPPNGYGLYDVIGNVYEWNLDMEHASYEGAPGDGSAWLVDGIIDHQGRISRTNRGGSWFQPTREMTITRRCADHEETRRNELGFRVLLER